MKYAFLYPGQGSQAVGMGKDLYDAFPSAKKRFDEANDILGRDLKKIIFEGPQEDLTATQNTQPSLFTIEVTITDILSEKGIKPSVTAGHSLGEYSALYGAGVLSFEDGLRAVAKRGALMAEAGKANPGTMAAVIGMGRDAIVETLKKVTSGIVVTANENSPEQTVISGEIAAVNQACELLKAAGAKRAMVLPVSGAFHSPLMQSAADQFGSFIKELSFNTAVCPVIANVTGSLENDADTLRSLLLKQLISPVKWVDSMGTLAQAGCEMLLETGPGAVLKGLAPKCNSSLNLVSCGTAANIYSVTNS